eukprot:13353358-Heterocapsa_arctica.AAC.1
MSRFHAFSRQLLRGPRACLSVDEAAIAMSYSARRVLPTVADLAKYAAEERLKLGGWLDSEATELQKRSSMPDRYCDRKLDVDLSLKLELLASLRSVQLLVDKDWPQLVSSFPRRSSSSASLPKVLLPFRPLGHQDVEHQASRATGSRVSSADSGASSSSSRSGSS